jgi:hypothetical protein
MAFLTSLLTAYGGRGQGREERAQFEEDKRKSAADLALRKQQEQAEEADRAASRDLATKSYGLQQQQAGQATALSRAQLAALGRDERGNPLPQIPLPPELAPKPLPVITDKMTPEQKSQALSDYAQSEYTRLIGAINFVQTNHPERTDLVAGFQAQLQNIASPLGPLGNIAYTAGGKLPLATATIGLDAARAKRLKEQTGIDWAKIKQAGQLAVQKNAAAIDTANIRAASAQGVALTNQQTRIDASLLTGYYSLQHMDIDAASRLAVAQVTGAERLAAADVTATKDPNAAGLVLGGGGGGGNTTTVMPISMPPVQQAPSPPVPISDGKGGIKGYWVQGPRGWQPVSADAVNSAFQPPPPPPPKMMTDPEYKAMLGTVVSHVHDAQSLAHAEHDINVANNISKAQRAQALAAVRAAVKKAPPAIQAIQGGNMLPSIKLPAFTMPPPAQFGPGT